MSMYKKIFFFSFILLLVAITLYFYKDTTIFAPFLTTKSSDTKNRVEYKTIKETSGVTKKGGDSTNIQTYTNNKLGFTLQYPKDWELKEGSTTPGGYVKTKEEYEVILKKLDYEIVLLIGDTTKGGFVSPSNRMVYVGAVDNTKVYRTRDPVAEFEGVAPHFNLGFYEKTSLKTEQEEYVFNSDLVHTGLHFSISYYLFGNNTEKNYDRAIIDEADTIISSLSFTN